MWYGGESDETDAYSDIASVFIKASGQVKSISPKNPPEKYPQRAGFWYTQGDSSSDESMEIDEKVKEILLDDASDETPCNQVEPMDESLDEVGEALKNVSLHKKRTRNTAFAASADEDGYDGDEDSDSEEISRVKQSRH